jgi:1-acyl-sn-glycerol-3-phosphate acyltransferase
MSSQPWQHQAAPVWPKAWEGRGGSIGRDRAPLMNALRMAVALPLRSYLRVYHRFEMTGREHLPRHGSFVMVANHASHLDALCLLAALPLSRLRHAHSLAAQDYFFGSLLRFIPAALFVNAIPFARKEHLRRSLDMCRRLLQMPGNILIFFPEGTRTTTGELGEFRAGIGALVAGTHVPVVPCGLLGTHRAWPKGTWLPRPRKLQLVIGEPRQFFACRRGRESSHLIARELHAAVKKLLQQ